MSPPRTDSTRQTSTGNRNQGLSIGSVNPIEAIEDFFRRGLTAKGRSSPSAYWWSQLGFVLMWLGTAAVSPQSGAAAIVFLILLVPNVMVTIRRLHDTGRSGLWALASFVPLVGLVVLAFLVESSGPDNQYGPNPFPEKV